MRGELSAERLQELLHSRFVLSGYARRVVTGYDICDDGIRVAIYLLDARVLGYTLSAHEMAMEGIRGFEYWLRRIDEEVRRYAAESGAARADVLYGYAPFRPQLRIYDDFASAGHDPKAIQKAKDLFKLACGKKSFDILESGKGLAIVGSKGTGYTLHNRATYCVERIRDGAKLCAVVPNVPLFDHLLGIKLMVEHDEPAFLKIANITGGERRTLFGGLDDPYRWGA